MKIQVLHHHLQDVQFDISNWGEAKISGKIFCLMYIINIINTSICYTQKLSRE